jgi:hypothetical protein
MDVDVINSLIWYTGGEYDALNNALRTNTPLQAHVANHWANIQKAFALTKPITEPLIVYRGKRSNTMYPVLSPLSTSKTIRGTEDFVGETCCMLIITVSPGTKAIDLSELSDIASEAEVLLPPGGTLVLTHRTVESYKYTYITKDLETLYMTYIPQIHVEVKLDKPPIDGFNSIVREFTVEQLLGMIDPDEYEFILCIEDAMIFLEYLGRPYGVPKSLLQEAAEKLTERARLQNTAKSTEHRAQSAEC